MNESLCVCMCVELRRRWVMMFYFVFCQMPKEKCWTFSLLKVIATFVDSYAKSSRLLFEIWNQIMLFLLQLVLVSFIESYTKRQLICIISVLNDEAVWWVEKIKGGKQTEKAIHYKVLRTRSFTILAFITFNIHIVNSKQVSLSCYSYAQYFFFFSSSTSAQFHSAIVLGCHLKSIF